MTTIDRTPETHSAFHNFLACVLPQCVVVVKGFHENLVLGRGSYCSFRCCDVSVLRGEFDLPELLYFDHWISFCFGVCGSAVEGVRLRNRHRAVFFRGNNFGAL